jgi:hypothetical protein
MSSIEWQHHYVLLACGLHLVRSSFPLHSCTFVNSTTDSIANLEFQLDVFSGGKGQCELYPSDAAAVDGSCEFTLALSIFQPTLLPMEVCYSKCYRCLRQKCLGKCKFHLPTPYISGYPLPTHTVADACAHSLAKYMAVCKLREGYKLLKIDLVQWRQDEVSQRGGDIGHMRCFAIKCETITQ